VFRVCDTPQMAGGRRLRRRLQLSGSIAIVAASATAAVAATAARSAVGALGPAFVISVPHRNSISWQWSGWPVVDAAMQGCHQRQIVRHAMEVSHTTRFEPPPSRCRLGWLSLAASAVFVAAVGGSLPAWADFPNSTPDSDSFVKDSQEDGESSVYDEQALLMPSSRRRIQDVAAKLEKEAGVRAVMIAPPQGLSDMKKRSYIQGIRQSNAIDGIILVADASATKPLELKFGGVFQMTYPDLFPKSYVKAVEAPPSGLSLAEASVAAFENIAACLLRAKQGKITTCNSLLPESEVKSLLS